MLIYIIICLHILDEIIIFLVIFLQITQKLKLIIEFIIYKRNLKFFIIHIIHLKIIKIKDEVVFLSLEI